MFTEKGEVLVSVSYGNIGFNLQSAVAIVDHVAVMGNFAFSERESEDHTKHGKYYFRELGIGYFNTFRNDWKYEIFGGYGNGKSEGYGYYEFLSSDRVQVRGGFERYFLQTAIGTESKIWEGALSTRFAHVNFYHFKQMGASESYTGSVKALRFEPAATLKVGTDRLKFVGQFGLCVSLKENVKFDYEPSFISIGLQCKLPVW